jgi:transposase InsO family protein
MSHANAVLTPKGRLALAQCVVEDKWSLRRAAERFQTSPQTAKRCADRYRARDVSRPAVEAMADRSSRPLRSPTLTPRPKVRKIVHLRNSRGWGPARIAHKLGMHASTVNGVRRREGLPRLDEVDLATRRAVRGQVVRYERDAPCDLVHVDIKKLGNIPDGGGHHSHGRAVGRRNSRAHTTVRHNGQVRIGYGYVHTAIDDHSRLAYSEIHRNETAATATGFWRRAVAWFAAAGVKIRRVITDNGSCYRSRLWRSACAELGITAKYTRPYRPPTNGKVERFHRTLLVEWAYARPYRSEAARAKALTKFIHLYNHHRTHTALGGATPASRVTNLSGQYT